MRISCGGNCSKRIIAYYGKIAAAGKSYGFDDVIAGTIEKNSIPGIGDIGIFQKDNGIYIKEVGENELLSHNTKYKPIINNGDIFV